MKIEQSKATTVRFFVPVWCEGVITMEEVRLTLTVWILAIERYTKFSHHRKPHVLGLETNIYKYLYVVAGITRR